MTPTTAVTRLSSIVRLRCPATGPARAPVAQPHILVSVQLFTFQGAADAKLTRPGAGSLPQWAEVIVRRRKIPSSSRRRIRPQFAPAPPRSALPAAGPPRLTKPKGNGVSGRSRARRASLASQDISPRRPHPLPRRLGGRPGRPARPPGQLPVAAERRHDPGERPRTTR